MTLFRPPPERCFGCAAGDTELAVRHSGITGVGFTLAFAVPLLWGSQWPSAVRAVVAR